MKTKQRLLTGAGILLLLAGMAASIHIGAKNIPASDIYHALFEYENTINDQLIRDVRLPRMLCAVLAGGMLSLAGTMMQGVMRNPVAEPSVMGVTQSAVLFVAVASVTSFSGSPYRTFFMALAGALLSGIFLFLFTMHSASNQNMSRILLAGTALGTFFLSLASIIALLGSRSQELAFWIAGGFGQAGWVQTLFLTVIGGTFSAAALFLSGRINIISLGDETAAGLGLSPVNVRLATILCLVPICAVCVAAAGNIAFIGLFVPHILRRLIGNDYRKLMPLSFLYGSITLVTADIAARTVSSPYELPVGLFTAMIGVPVFLTLIRKEKN